MYQRQGKIFVSHHKEFWTHESEIFTPIHVGKKNSNIKLNMIGDDTGDNISHRNPNYCELTALYWAWKNVYLDYVGFCHYRRYFIPDHTLESSVTVNEINDNVIQQYKICDDDAIYKYINDYDIILPYKIELGDPIAYNYMHVHISQDWKILMQVLMAKYPDILPLIEQVFYAQTQMYAGNMFIMNADIFNIYMDWLFDILFEAEKHVLVSLYPYQSRVYGFMAERLFNLFLVILTNKFNAKIIELPTILLEV